MIEQDKNGWYRGNHLHLVARGGVVAVDPELGDLHVADLELRALAVFEKRKAHGCSVLFRLEAERLWSVGWWLWVVFANDLLHFVCANSPNFLPGSTAVDGRK